MSKDSLFLKNYNIYKDKIYNYIWYRVNFNDALAEDLTSEIFLKAYEKFDTFDADKPFQAWIYRIAKNHLFNYYRVANREVELTTKNDISEEVGKKIEVSLELERVIKKINCLEGYCREVLLLRFVDELDNTEIAKVLNKDERAIRTQISRALKILRKEL